MATLHIFPRSHCKQPALEQQLAIIAIALVERYGIEIATGIIHGVASDIEEFVASCEVLSK